MLNTDFRTTDLNRAAYLYASSVPFVGLDKTDPENIVFIFNTPAQALLDAWESGVANGNIQLYTKARSYLLNLVKRG